MAELTVCMPVYNGEKYLNESISSVLNQTFCDFRFLIYDDGSTDDTVKIVESFHDDRITLIKGGENKGNLYARVKLIEAIDTKYNMWIDDDDYFCRDDAFEDVMRMIKEGDYDMVHFIPRIYEYFDGRTLVVTPSRIYRNDFEYCGDEFLEKVFPVDDPIWFMSRIFKTDLMKKSIPEEEFFKWRSFGNDCFFAPMWYFHMKRYCHKVDFTPMYHYRCGIGIWGEKQRKMGVGFYLDMMNLRYNVLLSCHRRMSQIRNLTSKEERNLVEGDGFFEYNLLNLCKKIRCMKEEGKDEADAVIKSWREHFCADGVHILNGYDGYALPDYAMMLNNLLK